LPSGGDDRDSTRRKGSENPIVLGAAAKNIPNHPATEPHAKE
jgi:hypothetical protein